MERTAYCLGVAMKRLKRLLVSRQKFEEEKKREEAEKKVHILEETLQKKVLPVPEEKTSREEAEKDLKLTVPLSASSPSCGVSEGNQQPHEKKQRGKKAWGFAKKDNHLGGLELHQQVNDNKTCMYTFDQSFKLKAGRCVTMWAAGYGPNRSNTELEWKDLKPWKTGDRVWFTLDSFWMY
ncbi:uncharacterized protein LOC117469888 isoform X2 [Trematomus bernacchii]|uniref:uncharacterized protein LOC117469888 isoform X2 n=1 Tax=Trematomus bernacchii TaxID=40690 RepID=UPI00146CF15A|nr:uncharacterized protein LOC117469888 isoform X2 [Trematomus bernacchii]